MIRISYSAFRILDNGHKSQLRLNKREALILYLLWVADR